MNGVHVSLLTSLLRRRDIWKRIAIERLTEPLHLNVIAAGLALLGSTRSKIAFDLLPRQHHAFGLLHAADTALARGARSVTIVELGVGSGTGLINLCDLAIRVSKATGIAFHIVGFDTGVGMPPPVDFRDHPELYKEGWFPMGDREALMTRLPSNARLILGDLRDTIPKFVETLQAESPLGFVTLDVDFYSSSKHALALLQGPPSCYFPYISVYVDDMALPTNSYYAGELLAISEFNRDNQFT